MRSPTHERPPLTPGERAFYGFFLAIVVGLFAAEIVHDYKPVKLAALLFVLFWGPLLALHETGHAVVAALVGRGAHGEFGPLRNPSGGFGHRMKCTAPHDPTLSGRKPTGAHVGPV